MSTITLSLIAKATPPPNAALALAYDLQALPSSTIVVEFVHTLPEGASTQLDVDG